MSKAVDKRDSGGIKLAKAIFFTVVLFIAWGGILQSLSLSDNEHQNESVNFRTESPLTYTIHLPLVIRPDTFLQNHSIWVHSSAPDSHEVVLFRHPFTLTKKLEEAQFLVFADTRYEMWIDGAWVGRGPTRFSRTRQEYDVYRLDDLQPGAHLIAVLVQWAPNTRRSESDTPHLIGHLQGMTSEGFQMVTRTGPQWKVLRPDAWRKNAVPVHSWELIGPTELVDLRELPHNWMLPTFSDDGWSAAVVKDLPGEPLYQPRSIPFLANVPFTPTVVDVGLLSPGYEIGELEPSTTDPYSLTFEALNSTEFVVETLTGTEVSLSGLALLDGDELKWEKAGDHRPDVYTASTAIGPGPHNLSFVDVPPQGATFNISRKDLQIDLPFQQGIHAGRRLLLAEPVSRSDAVSVSHGAGMTVEFTTSPAYSVLDLGRTVHGRLTADVVGPASSVIDIGWDERLLTGTLRPLPYPGSLNPQWNQVDSWTLDGTPRSISTIDARAGRYILIAAWNGAPIKLENITVYEERYPVEQRGEFHSSNPLLYEIWQVGVDTLRPNMNDAYTDTPWRERGQWWGDAYVEDHINRAAFGDTALLRRGLLFMADAFEEGRPPALAPNSNGTLLLDYGMLWVQNLYDYWQSTGDRDFAIQVYHVLPEFMSYLESYENPNTGLLDVPFGKWWETALIDWAGYHSRYGQSTALNALYYGTLRDAADIAEATDNAADALKWSQKAELVKQQVNARLYLPSQRRYATSFFEGELITPTIHAQAWPLAYDMVPGQYMENVTSSLVEMLPDPYPPSDPWANIEIYGMFWVLEALGKTNRIPEALDLIEAYYGRLLDLGAVTWWEGVNSHLRYPASLSHGWGGAPTWFLTTYVLGARRLKADTWMVKPAFSGVRYATGTLPLQDGELQAHWECQGFGSCELEVIAPITTTGEVVIPFSDDTRVLMLNGDAIWQGGTILAGCVIEQLDGIHVSLPRGSHTLYVLRD
jgi:alpha-L-rhamnosidase